MQNKPKRALIVWIYYPAFGHMLEALDAAARFFYANKDIEVDILVNRDTAYEITNNAPWVKNCYTVDLDTPNNLADIFAQSWDYYIFPKRYKYTPQDYPAVLLALNKNIVTSYLKDSVIRYDEEVADSMLQINEEAAYTLNPKQESIEFVQKATASNNYISILLFGASPEKIYPSNTLWIKVVKNLLATYKYDIVLTGVTSSANGERTTKLIEELCSLDSRIKKFVDVGLQNQIALLHMAKVFISPHTGFGFLASMCATPWLILSGGRWSDLAYAQTPYYSVFPKKKCYPCHGKMKAYCRFRLKLNKGIDCYTVNTQEYLEEINEGLDFLVNDQVNFQQFLFINKANAERKGLQIDKNSFLRYQLSRLKTE